MPNACEATLHAILEQMFVLVLLPWRSKEVVPWYDLSPQWIDCPPGGHPEAFCQNISDFIWPDKIQDLQPMQSTWTTAIAFQSIACCVQTTVCVSCNQRLTLYCSQAVCLCDS